MDLRQRHQTVRKNDEIPHGTGESRRLRPRHADVELRAFQPGAEITAGRLVSVRPGSAVGAVMDLKLRLLKFLIVVDEVVVGEELIVDSTSASR